MREKQSFGKKRGDPTSRHDVSEKRGKTRLNGESQDRGTAVFSSSETALQKNSASQNHRSPRHKNPSRRTATTTPFSLWLRTLLFPLFARHNGRAWDQMRLDWPRIVGEKWANLSSPTSLKSTKKASGHHCILRCVRTVWMACFPK